MNTIVMKPVCIGRFELSSPGWRAGLAHRCGLGGSHATAVQIAHDGGFLGLCRSAQAVPAIQKHDTEPSLLSLYEKVGITRSSVESQEPSNDVVYYLERYVWLGDRGYFFKGLGEGDEIKAKLEGYKKILGRLVPHDGLERPVTNGIVLMGRRLPA
uniref:hypothetical protein n=1 Tax=Xanthomonas oryzae TaxID=347 RepID=UPI003DA0A0C0